MMPSRFLTARAVLCVLSVLGIFAIGCRAVYGGGMREEAYQSSQYQGRPTLESSLFKADQSGMGEEAIQRVLSSKLELPRRVEVAILKLPEVQQQAIRFYGYGYVRSEEYLKNQQALIDTIVEEVDRSSRVSGTTLLPSILTPKEPTLSLIRESSVRLQSDVLLVFHVTSDIYNKTRFLQPNQAKGYCTCEGFLLDVRTGLIPFSRIVTRDFLATKDSQDANFTETMSRAEREAALLALRKLGQDVAGFLDRFPQAMEDSPATSLQGVPEKELSGDEGWRWPTL